MTENSVRNRAPQEELAAAEEALRVSERRYRIAFETSLDAISISRIDDGMFVDVNRQFFSMLGYPREELVGQTSAELCLWTDFDGEDHRGEFLDVAGRSSLEIGIWEEPGDRRKLIEILRKDQQCRQFETRFRKKSGDLLWVQLSASTIELDGVACMLLVTRDISAVKASEEEIRNLSLYDAVTCLPNRRHMLDHLHARQQDAAVRSLSALLSVNLDHFRIINDSLGPLAGDRLLREAGRRVLACVREGDTVARTGGDEFSVLLGQLGESEEEAAAQAQNIAQRVLAALDEPYVLDETVCHCTASIGIAILGDRALRSEEILQQSSIAVEHARLAGRNTARFYAPALQTAISERVALEADLRRGIESGQLLLCYQPQIQRGQLAGAEALVRWRHPARGLVPPSVFIPMAEETGLILPLGAWVLEAACRQAAEWKREGAMPQVTIAVNISARQFRQPDFTASVLNTIARTGVDPRDLELELTESTLVDDVEAVVVRMQELREHGLQFSVDDFGVGYSCLSYLRRLPLDQLKIDRSFVRDLLTDPGSSAIARAIVSLAEALGLSVIAEGVETEAQREHLSRLGCHGWQGFLCSEPLPADEFEGLVARLQTKGKEGPGCSVAAENSLMPSAASPIGGGRATVARER
ncbi:MAG: putative bifunctional diguanylate cyclase/phosphodiesterase [Acidobacteriota bacterium]